MLFSKAATWYSKNHPERLRVRENLLDGDVLTLHQPCTPTAMTSKPNFTCDGSEPVCV